MSDSESIKPTHFGVIPWETFCDALDISIDHAISLLIISLGTRYHNFYYNNTSNWSAKAINEYSGIARTTATKIINKLVEHSILEKIGETRPKYRIRYQEGNQLIYIPASLFNKFADGNSAIKKLKEGRKSNELKLLIWLYSKQDMEAYGGIDRNIVWKNYIGRKERDIGLTHYKLVSFIFNRIRYFNPKLIPIEKFWESFQFLESQGLIESIPYLCEYDDVHNAPPMLPLDGSLSHEISINEINGNLPVADESLEYLEEDQYAINILLNNLYQNAKIFFAYRLRFRVNNEPERKWHGKMNAAAYAYLQAAEGIIASNDYIRGSDSYYF